MDLAQEKTITHLGHCQGPRPESNYCADSPSGFQLNALIFSRSDLWLSDNGPVRGGLGASVLANRNAISHGIYYELVELPVVSPRCQ
jgi:hypothetical protein